MDLHRLRWGLLKIFTVVLVISTWVFAGFVMQTRPEETAAPADALSSLVRLPASLPAQLPERIPGVFSTAMKAQEPVKMSVLKLGCWDMRDHAVQHADARWIRLTGRPCQTDTSADRISVQNLTNGYNATVFASSAGADLTTDFIPLETGSNKILLRFDEGANVTFENQILLQH